MQSPRHSREIAEARSDVSRSLLEDATPLVLRERPPRIGLVDRDERGARRGRTAQRWLAASERLMLGPRDVPLVACDAAQHPRRHARRRIALEDVEVRRGGQCRAATGHDALDRPRTAVACGEDHMARSHRLTASAQPTVPPPIRPFAAMSIARARSSAPSWEAM